jgi:hypothetical protein
MAESASIRVMKTGSLLRTRYLVGILGVLAVVNIGAVHELREALRSPSDREVFVSVMGLDILWLVFGLGVMGLVTRRRASYVVAVIGTCFALFEAQRSLAWSAAGGPVVLLTIFSAAATAALVAANVVLLLRGNSSSRGGASGASRGQGARVT